MALIICPECGEKISSKSEHCVHCGGKIIVCPECEKIYTENIEICTECGYVINQAKNQSNAKKSEDDDIRNVVKLWEAQSKVKILSKSIVGFILFIATIAMILLAIGSIMTWRNGDMITTYQKTFSNIQAYYIIAGIFYLLLSFHNNVAPNMTVLDFSRWADINKIDLKMLSEKALDIDFKKITTEETAGYASDIKFSVTAAMYSDDLIIKTKQRNQGFVRVVFSAIIAVPVIFFLISNSQIYMYAEFMSSDLLDIGGFEFKMIQDWWLVILAAVAWIANMIYGNIIEKQEVNARNEWVKNNMPSYFERYDRYVNKMIDYIVDSLDKTEKLK